MRVVPAAEHHHACRSARSKEATIYGFPMVDSYRIQYAYFLDERNPEYKAPWNTLKNVLRRYSSRRQGGSGSCMPKPI
jgi:hypothetical protein